MNTYMVILSVLVWSSDVTFQAFDHKVKPSCLETDDECSFNFTLDYLLTMTLYNWSTFSGSSVFYRNGTFCKLDKVVCSKYNIEECIPISDEELDDVVTVDGSAVMIYSINQQFPGPSIVVYENQKVTVNIYNNLIDQVVTIHWHGIQQTRTPWMDGVPMISQFPILPQQHFTYSFNAYPSGSHWYHSHFGTQRSLGLAGAIVILPRSERSDITDIDEDYLFILQDWFPARSDIENVMVDKWDMTLTADIGHSRCTTLKRMLDGNINAQIPFEGALINGKGRITNSSTLSPEQENVPREIFHVQKNTQTRFRIMNFGMNNGFRITIDQHSMILIGTDGNDIVPVTVDYLVIFEGESFDVILVANATPGNYWIRMETLDSMDLYLNPILPNITFAHLHYKEVDLETPDSTMKTCTTESNCVIANCPYGKEVMEAENNVHQHMECLPITSLASTDKALVKDRVPIPYSDDDFQEFFLNFNYDTVYNPAHPQTSINNIVFEYPPIPLTMFPNYSSTLMTSCNVDVYPGKQCKCTHILKVRSNTVIQLVLNSKDGSSFNPQHPIHMHGKQFHVLKMGFPDYNSTTGMMKESANTDLTYSEDFSHQGWSNASWNNDNVPGLNLINPPLKNTVIVPRYGYTVVRFRASSPGFWLLHCHTENHQLLGMTLVLQVGNITEMPKPPDFYTYFYGQKDTISLGDTKIALENTAVHKTSNDSDLVRIEPGWLVLIILIIVCVILVNALVLVRTLFKKAKANQHSYQRLSGENDTRVKFVR